MTVRVRFFAILKDRAGTEAVDLALPDRSTVGEALDVIAGRYASLAALLPRVAPAVNRAYGRRDDVLQDGDELALIPPVSGG
jgi:MoaE-MoaD fusion protein